MSDAVQPQSDPGEVTAKPTGRLGVRAAYGIRQLSRVAWYLGHGLAMQRLAEHARERDPESTRPPARTSAPVPDRDRLFQDMTALFRRDLANVEAGIYPLPDDHDGSLALRIRRSRLFFQDLPEVHRRRENGEHKEVLSEATRGKRPRYYLQNFHFQSGGWMTDDSAQRYDTQVEVLFNGSANAIRRQL
ncbi:class I SAM-dependent methyltransferase, partial [Methylobacterium oxalidis]